MISCKAEDNINRINWK